MHEAYPKFRMTACVDDYMLSSVTGSKLAALWNVAAGGGAPKEQHMNCLKSKSHFSSL